MPPESFTAPPDPPMARSRAQSPRGRSQRSRVSRNDWTPIKTVRLLVVWNPLRPLRPELGPAVPRRRMFAVLAIPSGVRLGVRPMTVFDKGAEIWAPLKFCELLPLRQLPSSSLGGRRAAKPDRRSAGREGRVRYAHAWQRCETCSLANDRRPAFAGSVFHR